MSELTGTTNNEDVKIEDIIKIEEVEDIEDIDDLKDLEVWFCCCGLTFSMLIFVFFLYL